MKKALLIASAAVLTPTVALAQTATNPYDGFLTAVQEQITAATPVMLAIMLAMGGFAILKRIASTMFPSLKKGA